MRKLIDLDTLTETLVNTMPFLENGIGNKKFETVSSGPIADFIKTELDWDAAIWR